MKKYKVGVVGYGTIGKRVADAVMLQDDMELVGVTAHSFNYRIAKAQIDEIPIYSFLSRDDQINQNSIKIAAENLRGNLGRLLTENLDKSLLGNDSVEQIDLVKSYITTPVYESFVKSFKDKGINITGGIDDLFNQVDVVVDCSPKPLGALHKKLYERSGVKAIYQGGEKKDVADISFVAQANYKDAVGKDSIRVVSCNTTGLIRTLHALDNEFGVRRARATLIRRGTDPGEIKKGPINAIVASSEFPSHHGLDTKTVLYNMEVFTTAYIVPTTIMHVHSLSVHLENTPDNIKDVIELFKNTTRIRVLPKDQVILSTAQIMDMARDEGHIRGDMMEICVWEDAIGKVRTELFYAQAIHQESNVIPENIDAIRAVMGFKNGQESIEKTNKSLNIK